MVAWSYETLESVLDRVIRAGDLDSALAAMVESLREEYDLWGGLAVVYTPEGNRMLAAVHAIAPTFFEPGMEIATNITPANAEHWEALQRGHVVGFDVADTDLGLLRDLLLADGVAAVGAFPIHDEDEAIGAIRLWSTRPGAFARGVYPLLTGIGRGVEAHLVTLLRSAGWLPGASQPAS